MVKRAANNVLVAANSDSSENNNNNNIVTKAKRYASKTRKIFESWVLTKMNVYTQHANKRTWAHSHIFATAEVVTEQRTHVLGLFTSFTFYFFCCCTSF